jgi:hypothetical protein
MSTALTESQAFRVCYMVGRGATLQDICDEIPQSVSTSLVKFFIDRAGIPQPSHDTSKTSLSLSLDKDVFASIDAIARARGVAVSTLLERMLVSAVARRIVDAVIDGGATT